MYNSIIKYNFNSNSLILKINNSNLILSPTHFNTSKNCDITNENNLILINENNINSHSKCWFSHSLKNDMNYKLQINGGKLTNNSKIYLFIRSNSEEFTAGSEILDFTESKDNQFIPEKNFYFNVNYNEEYDIYVLCKSSIMSKFFIRYINLYEYSSINKMNLANINNTHTISLNKTTDFYQDNEIIYVNKDLNINYNTDLYNIYVNDEKLQKCICMDQSNNIKLHFTYIYRIYIESTGGNGWCNNDSARYAWDSTYVLEALIKMYELYKDYYYLDLFEEIADKMIKTTDKQLNIYDQMRNIQINAWSCSRYYKFWAQKSDINDVKSTIHCIHSGFICWNFLKFYNLVKNQNLTSYNTIADKLLEISLENFNFIETEWVETTDKGGYFKDSPLRDIEYSNDGVPINKNIICGMFCIELYYATKNIKYKNYFIKVAENFKYYINKEGQGSKIYEDCITWDYFPTATKYVYYDNTYKTLTPRTEDIAHGAFAVDIIEECVKLNVVFNESYLIKFTNTFIKLIHKGGNNFTYNLDGTETSTSSMLKYSGRINLISKYLPLAKYNKKIYNIINNYYINRNSLSVTNMTNNSINDFYLYGGYLILPFVNLLYYRN